jgi:multiple RNA-binding domain-containing protein 1
MLPEHAVKAYEALDMKTFQGRLLHIIPGEEKPPTKEEEIVGVNGTKLSSVKKEKEKKRRNLAGNDFNWNSLYMSVSCVILYLCNRLICIVQYRQMPLPNLLLIVLVYQNPMS